MKKKSRQHFLVLSAIFILDKIQLKCKKLCTKLALEISYFMAIIFLTFYHKEKKCFIEKFITIKSY